MKRLVLTRFCYAPDDMGTFGILTIEGHEVRWWTVERAWHNNEPSVSCIPFGDYELRRGTYTANGTRAPYPDLELVDVPGRSNIEIHAANAADELRGCIAPGKVLRLQSWRVEQSRAALREIMRCVEDDDELWLTILKG